MTPQRRNQLFVGSAIILMGLAMALSFAGVMINGQSPWVVFGILIPAVWALLFAWEHYWQHGRVFEFGTTWVFIPLCVAIFLIFNLNWAYLGAIVIILVGLSFLFGKGETKEEKFNEE
jgi:cell division protein FtsW (lipid II flippase)